MSATRALNQFFRSFMTQNQSRLVRIRVCFQKTSPTSDASHKFTIFRTYGLLSNLTTNSKSPPNFSQVQSFDKVHHRTQENIDLQDYLDKGEEVDGIRGGRVWASSMESACIILLRASVCSLDRQSIKSPCPGMNCMSWDEPSYWPQHEA